MTPLIRECKSSDTILVQINPIERPGTPRTAREIHNRLNEISFNATLMKELQMGALLRKVADPGDRRGRGCGPTCASTASRARSCWSWATRPSCSRSGRSSPCCATRAASAARRFPRRARRRPRRALDARLRRPARRSLTRMGLLGILVGLARPDLAVASAAGASCCWRRRRRWSRPRSRASRCWRTGRRLSWARRRGFLAQFFPLFLLGAVFGKLMEDSGSVAAIAAA